MPKLSADSLQKRFACSHCGRSFRGRQGLSGHIQWKHKEKQEQTWSVDEPLKLVQQLDQLKSMCKALGFSNHEIQTRENIVHNWVSAQIFCGLLHIVPNNNADFKTFALTSLARAIENEELKNRLRDDFKKLLEEHDAQK